MKMREGTTMSIDQLLVKLKLPRESENEKWISVIDFVTLSYIYSIGLQLYTEYIFT